jgi:hypothetical protein
MKRNLLPSGSSLLHQPTVVEADLEGMGNSSSEDESDVDASPLIIKRSLKGSSERGHVRPHHQHQNRLYQLRDDLWRQGYRFVQENRALVLRSFIAAVAFVLFVLLIVYWPYLNSYWMVPQWRRVEAGWRSFRGDVEHYRRENEMMARAAFDKRRLLRSPHACEALGGTAEHSKVPCFTISFIFAPPPPDPSSSSLFATSPFFYGICGMTPTRLSSARVSWLCTLRSLFLTFFLRFLVTVVCHLFIVLKRFHLQPSQRAWLTAVANNNYVTPTLALAHTLDQFSCVKTKIALVPEDLELVSETTRDLLRKAGFEVRVKPSLDCMSAHGSGASEIALYPGTHRAGPKHFSYYYFRFLTFILCSTLQVSTCGCTGGT